METETFYLVEVPGGDRRYVWRHLSPDYRLKLQEQRARIFRISVEIPLDGPLRSSGELEQSPQLRLPGMD